MGSNRYVGEERILAEARSRQVALATAAPTEDPAPPSATPVAVAAVAAAPVVAPAPRTAVPAPRTASPAPPVIAPAPAQACAAGLFCYPRLGIEGAIVPYDDCSGKTDVGTAIRQLTCVTRGIWLAGHAYTQFGRIAGFAVGDVVIALGRRFEITGSSVQRACARSPLPAAPLSLQTSLDATACGRVLVLQARPTG